MRENRIIDLHRAREIILDMVANDSAAFSMTFNEKHRDEFVDVTVSYEICGVHYAREDGALKLILNVNNMSPPEVDVDYDRFHEVLMDDIPRNFPFLVKDTYSISFDIDSLRDVSRQYKLGRFKEELGMMIEANNITMDEVLPLLLEFINESMKESSYSSIEEMLEKGKGQKRKNRPILEITPPGIPCPHCNGLLSEDALNRLMMRLYMKRRHRDGGPDY